MNIRDCRGKGLFNRLDRLVRTRFLWCCWRRMNDGSGERVRNSGKNPFAGHTAKVFPQVLVRHSVFAVAHRTNYGGFFLGFWIRLVWKRIGCGESGFTTPTADGFSKILIRNLTFTLTTWTDHDDGHFGDPCSKMRTDWTGRDLID